jgi:hypothetical protein
MIYAIQIPVFPLYDYRCKIKRLIKKIEVMNIFIDINVLKIEQLKILMYLLDDIDIFLKELIILFLQKLIKSLCKTVKILTLSDKCSSCDE